jgi:hypothetical protein
VTPTTNNAGTLRRSAQIALHVFAMMREDRFIWKAQA